MRRVYHKLSAATVKKIAAQGSPGSFGDGDNLYLNVSKAGTASWIFRYMLGGRVHEMGLGALRHVGLAEARRLADEARALKRQGTDPLAARRAKRQGAAAARAKTMTFQQCARAYITAHQKSWSAEHARQWVSSVETYCYPVFGSLSVAAIDTAMVMQVLEPLWATATETASRVRGRIENVLDWAKTREYRSGENPARWRGHLDNLLPKKSKIATIVHHPALPYRETAGFIRELRARDDDIGARALELLILCASRSAEVLEAPWSEFDLANRLWTIPAERMKGGKEQRVPLSAAALAILEKQQAIRSGDYVFAGRDNRPVGKNTLAMVLKRLGRTDLTVHGFRSTFADWCTERTRFTTEEREMALAHKVGTAVTEAYRRTDLFDKRRALAEAWARYCDGNDGGAEVIDLAAARSA